MFHLSHLFIYLVIRTCQYGVKLFYTLSYSPIRRYLGFAGGSGSKESACKVGRPRFDPWVGKIPWRREWQSTPVFWRISWTEEPGWLQFMGLQRVGYNWTTNTHKTALFVFLLKLFQVCPSEVHSGWLLCSFDMPLPFCLSEHFLTSWHCQMLQVYFIFSCGKRTFLTMRRHRRLQFDLWVRKIPWMGHGNPLQYYCLENSMDREAWLVTVHGVTKNHDGARTHLFVLELAICLRTLVHVSM